MLINKAAGFTTLVAAVEAAGLTQTLKSAGPFTVFAPTNDAFAALPAGTLDRLLKPENKQELTNILLCVARPWITKRYLWGSAAFSTSHAFAFALCAAELTPSLGNIAITCSRTRT